VDWELNPDELEELDDIGHGSTSRVYSAKYEGVVIAVKEIAEVDDGTLLAVRRELQVMTRINHPKLLKFIGLISVQPPLRLCLEYCAGGTLFDLLHNCWEVDLSWKQRLKILVDIASAMEYLHGLRKQIIHRDLKSLNIFLMNEITCDSDEPDVKIADFGFARIRQEIKDCVEKKGDWPSLTRGAGSMHWMAPEVYTTTHYHDKADIFSFSIVIYEVICRHMAFEDLDAESAAEEISQGIRPDLSEEMVPRETPDSLYKLMQRCWDHLPEQRPNFAQIHRELQAVYEEVQNGNYRLLGQEA
jgi:serine/threonine protein kinase